MRPLLLYIHGFKSSGRAVKAEAVREFIVDQQLAVDFLAPDLADLPEQAIPQLVKLIESELAAGRQRIGLVGSSLGGYYATWLVEKFGLRAVLVNPAVGAVGLMARNRGDHENPHTGNRFSFGDQQNAFFRSLEVSAPSAPEKLLLMVQTGDETLDYRQAVDYYRSSRQIVEPGGDHHFQGFDNHLPDVIKFLQLLD